MPGSILIALVVLLLGMPAFAQQLPEVRKNGMDLRKNAIEVPLKRTINPTFRPDVQRKSLLPAAPLLEERVVSVTDKGVKKVEPGKVCWHADFEAARAAARNSGRPVLLFAMLGSLDDKFC